MTDANQCIAFLFPGQGSQAVGMGKDLAEKYPLARQTFEEADEALGYKLSQLCFEGPEDQLRLTEITQPAILTASVATLRVLETRIPRVSYVAGHSLGEYSAHVASGTIGLHQAASGGNANARKRDAATARVPCRPNQTRPAAGKSPRIMSIVRAGKERD